MKITLKQAKQDLEKIADDFVILSAKGVEVKSKAQLALQTLEVAKGRLDSVKTIKLIYFDINGIKQVPEGGASILRRYVNNEITKEQAELEFQDTIKQYRERFQEAGLL